MPYEIITVCYWIHTHLRFHVISCQNTTRKIWQILTRPTLRTCHSSSDTIVKQPTERTRRTARSTIEMTSPLSLLSLKQTAAARTRFYRSRMRLCLGQNIRVAPRGWSSWVCVSFAFSWETLSHFSVSWRCLMLLARYTLVYFFFIPRSCINLALHTTGTKMCYQILLMR